MGRDTSDPGKHRWSTRCTVRTVPSTAEDPARHAEDLEAILDAEEIDLAIVVAHAGGGPTALDFAIRHTARTEALVLVDIALTNRDPIPSTRHTPSASPV